MDQCGKFQQGYSDQRDQPQGQIFPAGWGWRLAPVHLAQVMEDETIRWSSEPSEDDHFAYPGGFP
jgi:hypothetical protein